MHDGTAFTNDLKGRKPSGEFEAVGEDNDVGRKVLFVGWGFASLVFWIGVRTTRAQGHFSWLEAGDGLGRKVNPGIIETLKPESVKDAPLSADTVV